MKRFCFIILIVLMMFLSSCELNNGKPKTVSDNSKSQSSTTAAVSINPSTPMSISDIINSSTWNYFSNGQINVIMMSGLPGRLDSPKDTTAIYKKINSFLMQSVAYTKSVPKDNITHPFVENGGYLGPPVLTISDKQHKIVINPAWYIDTPDVNQFAVHQVPNILEVNFDGKIIYIQSPSFYNWMYNNKWESSFQNYTISSQ